MNGLVLSALLAHDAGEEVTDPAREYVDVLELAEADEERANVVLHYEVLIVRNSLYVGDVEAHGAEDRADAGAPGQTGLYMIGGAQMRVGTYTIIGNCSALNWSNRSSTSRRIWDAAGDIIDLMLSLMVEECRWILRRRLMK